MEIKVVLSLPRDAASVPVTRHVLDCCLDTLGVGSETRADIALALSEACANVIQHAGPGDDYEVSASTRDGRCVIEVVDTGDRTKTKKQSPEPASLLSEQGRGLQIIDAVVDDVSVICDGPAGTSLHFEKNLDWTPGALAEHLFAQSN